MRSESSGEEERLVQEVVWQGWAVQRSTSSWCDTGTVAGCAWCAETRDMSLRGTDTSEESAKSTEGSTRVLMLSEGTGITQTGFISGLVNSS